MDTTYDLLVIGGGINGTGHRPRCRRARLAGSALREGRSGRIHLLVLDQVDPRRPALPRILRVPVGARGADGARTSPEDRAAHHLAVALRAAAGQGFCGPRGCCESACFSTIIWHGCAPCPAPQGVEPAHLAGRSNRCKKRLTKGFLYSDCWVEDSPARRAQCHGRAGDRGADDSHPDGHRERAARERRVGRHSA